MRCKICKVKTQKEKCKVCEKAAELKETMERVVSRANNLETPPLQRGKEAQLQAALDSMVKQNTDLLKDLEQMNRNMEELAMSYNESLAGMDMEFKLQTKRLSTEFEKMKEDLEAKAAAADDVEAIKKEIQTKENKIKRLQKESKKKLSEEKFKRLSAGKPATEERKSASKKRSKKTD